MVQPTVQEKKLTYMSGFGFLIIMIVVWLTTLVFLVAHSGLAPLLVFLSFLCLISTSGFFVNEPNQAVVVTFFGTYIGSAVENGFFYTYPFTSKNRVSLKVVNIHTEKTKVNDAKGNPIEIAAVIVWKVASPYKALFGVDNYRQFISTQSDAAPSPRTIPTTRMTTRSNHCAGIPMLYL